MRRSGRDFSPVSHLPPSSSCPPPAPSVCSLSQVMARPGARLAKTALAYILVAKLLVTVARASATHDADIIIVGGGTAGCALAARLCAALPGTQVLLLERGAPRNESEELLVRSPLLAGATWTNPSISMAFPSEPNDGLGGRRVGLVTGATLGGSSSINVAQWTEPVDGGRGVASWGVAGLTAAAAERYFDRAARTLEVQLPPPKLRHRYLDDWLDAAAAKGLPRVTDPGGRGAPQPRRGVWLQRLTVNTRGRRVDAATAYVAPALRGACSRNLKVRQGVTVSKVLLTRCRGRSCGGRIMVHGVVVVPTAAIGGGGRSSPPRILRARLGVISAAGPYGSAPLLIRSGIGPSDALRSARVTPVVDLPVGEGILVRSLGVVTGAYDGVPLAPINNVSLLNDPETLRSWQAGRGGLLGAAASTGLGRVTDGDGAYFPASFAELANPGQPLFSAGCLPNPISRGRLSLPAGAAAAADPAAPPRVETNLLGDHREVTTLLSCMRTLRAVLRGFRPGFGMTETVPGTDTPLTEALVRRTADSGFHVVGGCNVGRVLDATLRVKGVDKLWVVDASVLPAMPRSAGPMSSVYMLAEHAAEALIRHFRGDGARESA